MENRVKIQEVQPVAWQKMYDLTGYLVSSKLTILHLQLIKIRASQINGCAYCIDLNTKTALKNGESDQRIFLLNAWKETDKFSEEEKVLLAITEEVTLINHQGLTDATYKKAKQFFSEEVIAQAIMAVVIINAWNRIAVSTQMPVE